MNSFIDEIASSFEEAKSLECLRIWHYEEDLFWLIDSKPGLPSVDLVLALKSEDDGETVESVDHGSCQDDDSESIRGNDEIEEKTCDSVREEVLESPLMLSAHLEEKAEPQSICAEKEEKNLISTAQVNEAMQVEEEEGVDAANTLPVMEAIDGCEEAAESVILDEEATLMVSVVENVYKEQLSNTCPVSQDVEKTESSEKEEAMLNIDSNHMDINMDASFVHEDTAFIEEAVVLPVTMAEEESPQDFLPKALFPEQEAVDVGMPLVTRHEETLDSQPLVDIYCDLPYSQPVAKFTSNNLPQTITAALHAQPSQQSNTDSDDLLVQEYEKILQQVEEEQQQQRMHNANLINPSDPLCLSEWPAFLWERAFTFNMPFPEMIQLHRNGYIVYLVQNCLRVHDNLALIAAAWLANRLQMPLIAVTLLDEAIVTDILGEDGSDLTENPSKRQRLDLSSVCNKSVAEISVFRKSILRVEALLAMERTLAHLHIPFAGFTFRTDKVGEAQAPSIETLSNIFNDCNSAVPVNYLEGGRLFAMFSDDFRHPAHIHLCGNFAKQMNIPMLAFDSNTITSSSSLSSFASNPDASIENFQEIMFPFSLSELQEVSWQHVVDFESLKLVQQKAFPTLTHLEVSRLFHPDFQSDGKRVHSIVDWRSLEHAVGELRPNSNISSAASIMKSGQKSVRFDNSSATKSTTDMMNVNDDCDLSASIFSTRIDSTYLCECLWKLNNSTTSEAGISNQLTCLLAGYRCGILSPLTIAREVGKTPSINIQILLNRIAEVEYCMAKVQTKTLPFARDINTNTFGVDWFAAFSEATLQIIFVDDNSGCLSKQLLSPIMLRSAKTPDSHFNQIQLSFMQFGVEFSSTSSLRYWISYYLLTLPTMKQGLLLAWKEYASHVLMHFDDNLSYAAEFILAVESIATELQSWKLRHGVTWSSSDFLCTFNRL